MSKIIIIVRNEPRISLISLVTSIISLISCKKGSYFGGRCFRGNGYFSGFRDTCEILSLLSEGRYFGGSLLLEYPARQATRTTS